MNMRKASSSFLGLLACSLVGLTAIPAHAIIATKAADVCALNADPCIVNTQIDIPKGLCTDNPSASCTSNDDCASPAFCQTGVVVLDFGVRDVQVGSGGQFNFGTSSGSILCGDFTASSTNPIIDANGPSGGSTDSGTVKLSARRKCSIGGGTAPNCVTNGECLGGACNTRRCSKNSLRKCTADAECKVGTCPEGMALRKTCSDSKGLVQCRTNADCDLGTCPAQLTCENRNTDPRSCTTNTDCNFGTCTVGTASITLGGPIVGNSASPAFLDFRAADNISLSKSINVAGTTAESDGGEVSMDATFGTITIAGPISATSGGLSTGGDVSLYAGTDVLVNEEIDVSGGDYDGGTTDFDGGRDVIITRSIFGNAGSGQGYGGEFLAVAGRDFSVTGISAANKTSLETSGHANLFNDAGDGGAQDFSADRDLTLNVNTRLITNGAAPDAIGGDIALDSSGLLTFNGDMTARGTGVDGSGGTIEAFGSKVTVGTPATVDLTGGSDGGGELYFYADTDLSWAGTADLSASNSGSGGAGTLESGANVNVSGTMKVNTGTDGSLDVTGCYITLTGTGKLDQALTNGINTLWADEQIRVNAGALMKTGPTGANKIRYRTAAKAPILNGTISPAPQLILDTNLRGCIVCGNGILDGAETCEDSNTANGDGCNSQCQNEACVAQTAAQLSCDANTDCGPGQTCKNGLCDPWLICEDGDFCTVDSCNDGQDTCVHTPKNCGDAFACTTDSCVPATGICQHATNNAACDDSNVCTNDVCSASTGCANNANTDPCNDGVECTTGDTCSNKACVGTPGEGCGFCGDGQKTGAEACDDGNATFTNGEYCGVNCVLIPCGKPTGGSLPVKSSDAQYTLRAAVGVATCAKAVCDVDNSGSIVATDAQRILRKAVGQSVVLNCPPAP